MSLISCILSLRLFIDKYGQVSIAANVSAYVQLTSTHPRLFCCSPFKLLLVLLCISNFVVSFDIKITRSLRFDIIWDNGELEGCR